MNRNYLIPFTTYQSRDTITPLVWRNKRLKPDTIAVPFPRDYPSPSTQPFHSVTGSSCQSCCLERQYRWYRSLRTTPSGFFRFLLVEEVSQSSSQYRIPHLSRKVFAALLHAALRWVLKFPDLSPAGVGLASSGYELLPKNINIAELLSFLLFGVPLSRLTWWFRSYVPRPSSGQSPFRRDGVK